MKKNEKLLIILFMIFFYLNLFACGIMTFSTWSIWIDNEQLSNIVMLLSINIISFVFSYFIIDIILHEIGHFILGKICGWNIYSFNIFGNAIVIKDKKIKIFKVPTNGLAAYVEQSPKNKDQNIILPLLGGIISNLILFSLFVTIAFTLKNPYIVSMCVAIALSNLVIAINNSIPFAPSAVTKTDMLQIVEVKESKKNNTFDYYLKRAEIYNMYNQKSIRDISDKEFLPDVKSNSPYITFIHTGYVMKLITLKKYDKALNLIDEMIENRDIDENDKISLSYEKLLCMILNKESKIEINKLYNSSRIKDSEKELEYVMSTELYAYYKLIKKDLKQENYYKDLVELRIKNTVNKYEKEMLIDWLSYINDLTI